MGLALALYDTVEVRLLASTEIHVEVHGEGAGQVPAGEDHLVVQAMRRTFDLVGVPRTGLVMTCTNANPHGRGLGSSASAVVSGIVAARALLASPDELDELDVLSIANEFEGHPDNVAPAIMGGATVAWVGPDGPRAVGLELDPAIAATALIPGTRLETAHARAILPATVPHADAAFNAGRAALLVEALARRPELLFDATEDRLHQEYRAGAMGTSMEFVRALRSHGFAAFVSGAGPTVLVLSPEEALPALDATLYDLVDGIVGWRAVRLGIDRQGVTAHRVPDAPHVM
jgi:homoserine kinase